MHSSAESLEAVLLSGNNLLSVTVMGVVVRVCTGNRSEMVVPMVVASVVKEILPLCS